MTVIVWVQRMRADSADQLSYLSTFQFVEDAKIDMAEEL
jgi:hypothetical protein